MQKRRLRQSLDFVFPPDPGALRLLAALRATLAGVLTFLLVILLESFVAVPDTDRILGFAVALFITATVRDGTPRQQLVTTALAPFAAFFATTVAALLLDRPIAAAAVVPLIMFAATYGASRGPRYASLGTVAVIAYTLGLVTRQPADTLPMRFVVLIIAAADAALIRRVLLRENPAAELARLSRAIHAGVGRALDKIAAAVAVGSWTEPARAEVTRDLRRLSDTMLLAQGRVAALPGQALDEKAHVRQLLKLELATERVSRVALRDMGTPSDRVSLLASLQAVRRGETPPPSQSTARLSVTLDLLGQVMHDPPEETVTTSAPSANAVSGLRPALQTAIAAGLAILGGDLVSPNRWYWAAFAAFVMFQGTHSRGESIKKGLQFMVGTLAGVVFGMLAATLLSGHEILTMAAIIIAVFLAFQANVAAYVVMMFWITVILGLLFGMLGYFTPDLLLMRLKEAATGAACGALVATLVMVRRDGTAALEARIAFLRALRDLLRIASRALLGDKSEPDLAGHILIAAQRFHDLIALSQSGGYRPAGLASPREKTERERMLLLEPIEEWASELGNLALQPAKLKDPALIVSVRETAAHIDETLAGLIDRWAAGSSAKSVASEPTEDLGETPRGELANRAARLLLRIDTALVNLASR
jgi:Fusaric acid resistance protein-like